MKSWLIFVMTMTILIEAKAEVVYYCHEYGDKSEIIKVEPSNNKFCLGSAAWGSDFCQTASDIWRISIKGASLSLGLLSQQGDDCKSTGYLRSEEYAGEKTSGKWQYIRIFDELDSSKNDTYLRAAFLGDINVIHESCYDRPFEKRQPVCYKTEE